MVKKLLEIFMKNSCKRPITEFSVEKEIKKKKDDKLLR